MKNRLDDWHRTGWKTILEVVALQVRVTRGQHGGETGDLLLAAFALAGLLEMTATTNRPQSSLAVEFLLQTSQHLVNGLAYFQSYLSQLNHFLSSGPWDDSTFIGPIPSGQGRSG